MSDTPEAYLPIRERGPWRAGTSTSSVDAKRVFVESDDFEHDVRLYVDGNFGGAEHRLAYAEEMARRLNEWQALQPAPGLPDSTNSTDLSNGTEPNVVTAQPAHAGGAEDLRAAAALVGRLGQCKTNGELLAEVLSYRAHLLETARLRLTEAHPLESSR